MSHDLDNLASLLGVDEADLLAWIEGETEGDADERMQRLLKAAPVDAAKHVVAMRRESILLNTMPREETPADLVAMAMHQASTSIERDMLLEDGEPIPFRQARTVVRTNWLENLVFNSLVGRLGVAAMLVLAGGSAVYLGMGVWKSDEPGEQPTFALNDAESSLDDAADINDAPEMTVVSNDDDVNKAAAEPASEAPIEIVVPEPMSLATALELCTEGRLLIRVSTESSLDTLSRLDNFVRESHPGRAWTMSRTDDEAVIASIERLFPETPATMSPQAPVLAADGLPESRVDVELEMLPPIPDLPPAVYMASVRLDESAIEALVESMQRGAVTGVELIELGDAVPAPRRPLTRESVLWWGRPVEEWLPRADVAVVVDVE